MVLPVAMRLFPIDSSLSCLLSVRIVIAFACVLLGACGHAPSPAECSEIVDKLADLELADQRVTDPAVIAQRKAEKKDLLNQSTQRCLGVRRVTDAAMACVRRATSYDEIETTCLR